MPVLPALWSRQCCKLQHDCIQPATPHMCSVLLLDYALKPAVHLLLTAVVGASSAQAISAALVGLYNLLWLFPAYLISFLVNCIW
jgi:hypothetical protein